MVPLCFTNTSRYLPYRLRSKRLKSLSDVTVAPVMPTEVSAHCSQNELHPTPDYCLAPPGNSLQSSFRLLFLLKRICLLKFCSYGNTKMSTCQVLLSTKIIIFHFLPFVLPFYSKTSKYIRFQRKHLHFAHEIIHIKKLKKVLDKSPQPVYNEPRR